MSGKHRALVDADKRRVYGRRAQPVGPQLGAQGGQVLHQAVRLNQPEADLVQPRQRPGGIRRERVTDRVQLDG
jgi:hypothetical protein